MQRGGSLVVGVVAGYRFQGGLGFRVKGLGFRVWGPGFRVLREQALLQRGSALSFC